ARAAGAALAGRFAAWPDEAPAAEHLARVAALLEELGWGRAGGSRPRLGRRLRGDVAMIHEALAGLAAGPPPAFPPTLAEPSRLLGESPALASGATDLLGGAGGGVQALSVTEARARTFDHLFVLGMNRDVFPRVVREDPLLPDALRAVLRGVLPDVPIKATGFDH